MKEDSDIDNGLEWNGEELKMEEQGRRRPLRKVKQAMMPFSQNNITTTTKTKKTTTATATSLRNGWPLSLFLAFVIPAMKLLTVCLLPSEAMAFENLIQAHGEVRKDLPAEPLHFAEPDWSIYHRTTHLHNDLIQLTSSCRNVRARLLLSTPDSSSSSSSSSVLRTSSAGSAQAPFTIKLGSDPLTAEDGLPYIILEHGEDADSGSGDGSSSSSSFASLFLRRRRNKFKAQNDEMHDSRESSVITTSMFVFGEEGRDLLSSEIAVRIVRRVCGNPATNDTAAGNSSNATEDVLPPRTRIILVPVANPDGRRISEMGRRCDRTNAKDVDVDRNWPSFWKEAESEDESERSASLYGRASKTKVKIGEAVVRHVVVSGDDESGTDRQASTASPTATNATATGATATVARVMGATATDATATGEKKTGEKKTEASSAATGPRPLSEPETRALKSLIERYTPSSYVAVRTGSLALTIPWDCKAGSLLASSAERLNGVLQSVAAGHCTRCRTGPLRNITGRGKCGTALDHVYGAMDVRFASAWYVYEGGVNNGGGDCFRRHNPVSAKGFERVVVNWMHAALNFTGAVRNWVVLEEQGGVHVAQMNATRSADQASDRRARAIARGDGDPEDGDPEDEDDATRGSRASHPRRPNLLRTRLRRPGGAASADLQQAGGQAGGSGGSGGSGLYGAGAAITVFGLCLLVAKRLVFKSAPSTAARNGRKLMHGPMKNA